MRAPAGRRATVETYTSIPRFHSSWPTKTLAGVSGIDGFKIKLRIGHKNFVTEQYLNPYYDDLHIYASNEVIKKFAEDDITSQQFINESIVLVNGNRVDVSLTQFK